MGQVLHGSARTTAAVRRAIQQSQESLNTLAERYAINPKTVAKWKKRTFVDDAPMGPKQAHSNVLTPEMACGTARGSGAAGSPRLGRSALWNSVTPMDGQPTRTIPSG